ncbi:hypothetical protein J6590_014563 [Homalodisca vitripennis]|nr:hypothetical protein J6590_014563 [Homalodisca vitripennis]
MTFYNWRGTPQQLYSTAIKVLYVSDIEQLVTYCIRHCITSEVVYKNKCGRLACLGLTITAQQQGRMLAQCVASLAFIFPSLESRAINRNRRRDSDTGSPPPTLHHLAAITVTEFYSAALLSTERPRGANAASVDTCEVAGSPGDLTFAVCRASRRKGVTQIPSDKVRGDYPSPITPTPPHTLQ